MPATPPRRNQPRHGAQLHPPGKENRAPPAAAATNVQLQPVQTPTKKTQVKEPTGKPDVVRRALSMVDEKDENQRWEFEVKHTFIHFGSPVKTLSVRTPPKTVPSNFAPERAALCPSPAASPAPRPSPAVATPWTVHRGALGAGPAPPAFGALPRAPPPPAAGTQPAAQQSSQGAPSLLHLSDFLPSPVVAPPPVPPAMPVGLQAGCPEVSVAMQGNWPGFEAVPPLPGSGLGPSFHCQPGQSPFGVALPPTSLPGFDAGALAQHFPLPDPVSTALAQPPPQAPPLALPPPPQVRACLGSTPMTTLTYPGPGIQFADTPTAAASAGLVATFPLSLGSDQAVLPPPAPMQEQVMSLHHVMPSCTQPSTSILASSVSLGARPPSSTTDLPQEPAPGKRVSICVSHFPEPGAAALQQSSSAQQRVVTQQPKEAAPHPGWPAWGS